MSLTKIRHIDTPKSVKPAKLAQSHGARSAAHDTHVAHAVRVALARYLRVETDCVLPHQDLVDDLGIDAFDLAIVASTIEERLDIEVPAWALYDTCSVAELVSSIAEAVAEQHHRLAAGE